MKTICVYCSSSNRVAPVYTDAAKALAAAMTASGYDLVYGGADAGLMGLVASEVRTRGGRVIGVIPKKLADKGMTWNGADEIVVTDDMRERKRVMDERAGGFIGLPGGFGTLEEMLEIMTLKQLQYHNKPIVFLNSNGFFDKLFELFSRIFDEGFARPEFSALYHVTDDPVAAVRYVSEYVPPTPIEKWGSSRQSAV